MSGFFEPSFVYAPYVPLQVSRLDMKTINPLKRFDIVEYKGKNMMDIMFADVEERSWMSYINWDIDQSGELVSMKGQRGRTLGVVLESTPTRARVMWTEPPLADREMYFQTLKNR